MLIKSKREYWKQQLDQLNEARTSKQFWDEMRKFRRPDFIPNELENEHWKDFYAHLLPSRFPRVNFPPTSRSPMDNAITEQEVGEALKHASNKKAPGPDKIPNEVWKNLPDGAIIRLTKEFNAILES